MMVGVRVMSSANPGGSPGCPERPASVRMTNAAVIAKTDYSGGIVEEATPDPISNSEVKLFRADGTAGATLWESRTLPG